MNPPAKTKPGPSSSMSGDTNKNVSVSAMEKIAREAGKLLMEKFHQHVKVEYKHEADLVTDADRKSEALILKRIRARWPKHNVIGEEGSRVAVGSDYSWLVDPLDGTTNFAHGFPMFCISLALERNSKRVAGVIYDPTRDELFAAEKGGGAYLNNKKIQVSSISQVGECLVATGLPSYKRQESLNVFFSHQMTLRTHAVRKYRIGGFGFGLRRVRKVGCLLGVKLEALGYGGWSFDCGGSWRTRVEFQGAAV